MHITSHVVVRVADMTLSKDMIIADTPGAVNIDMVAHADLKRETPQQPF